MPLSLTYQEALAYLLGFIDYSRTHQQNVSPENFDLDRMRGLLARLGDPHLAAPTIHIAGTKGKGSTAALCAAVLQNRRRTGLYTSPDLGDFTDRIQINRQPIPRDEFAALVEELKPHAEATPGVTSYELQTALAFLYFARQQTGANVIEVGMGGRLDSTNVVQPVVSVITSISLDHTYVLGNTLAAIAAEKGGIIKAGVPVVVAPQAEEALTMLKRISREKDSRLIEVDSHPTGEMSFFREGQDLTGQYIRFRFSGTPPEIFKIRLLGPHQAENAATAYAALRVAHEKGLVNTLAEIRSGFAAAEWPGRFEVMQTDPPVILDGAHNRHSAARLVETLGELLAGRPVCLLFGASEDKDIAGMFAELLPTTRWLIAIRSAHPRAAPPERLLELAAPYEVKAVAAPSIPEALEWGVQLGAGGGVLLATGSLYSLGEVRSAWLARGPDRPSGV
jgi:dihydrofolate synthase/folylpolyglutamate synthase